MSASGDRPWSLRRRIALATAGAACAVFAILGALVYRAVASSTAAQFDEILQQQAALTLRYADHEYAEGDTTLVPDLLTDTTAPIPFVYQITTRSNELLYRSPGAPAAALAAGSSGYSGVSLGGRPWRVYSLSSAASASCTKSGLG